MLARFPMPSASLRLPCSGPNHLDNFLFVQYGSFNGSIKASYDEFNCFMAGKEKTKRAVRIALAVSQDHTLLGKITKPRSGVKTLFHDTELFKKAARAARVPRRGYLRGKAPPGHRGDPSDKYTDDEVARIAKHLVIRGEEMWKKGFMQFIKMTSMTAVGEPRRPINNLDTLSRIRFFVDFN